MKLDGKVAIITGSGQGLGREMALAYAEEGASVVLAEIVSDKAQKVAKEVETFGKKALVIPTDVTVEEQANRMVQVTIDELGKVDILVNNVGGAPYTFNAAPTMISELSFSNWRAILDANLTSTFLCSKAVLRYMMQQKSGSIINISSGMGRKGRQGRGAYSAAKFAVEGLTQAMALEVAPFNIRVNALAPGRMTATPGAIRLNPDTPAEKMLPPRVIRRLAVYLASDEAVGITGQSFTASE